MSRAPTPTVRAASLNGFLELTHRLGLDGSALLREVGLHPRQLATPESQISLAAVSQVLENTARASGRGDIGLLLLEGRRPSNIGVAGMVAVLQPTLRDALLELANRRGSLCAGFMLTLNENNGIGVVSFDLVISGGAKGHQGVELIAGMLAILMRSFLGTDWMPRRVCLRHPPPADLRTHRQLLGWALEFGHDFNALVLTRDELDRPNHLADPRMGQIASNQHKPVSKVPALDSACKAHLMELVPHGQASIAQVALRMGMQPRTLQRRLAAEGLSFSDLLQAVREELVKDYLGEPAHHLAEIAAHLGFSSPSAFARWHRTRFGQTARQAGLTSIENL